MSCVAYFFLGVDLKVTVTAWVTFLQIIITIGKRRKFRNAICLKITQYKLKITTKYQSISFTFLSQFSQNDLLFKCHLKPPALCFSSIPFFPQLMPSFPQG